MPCVILINYSLLLEEEEEEDNISSPMTSNLFQSSTTNLVQ